MTLFAALVCTTGLAISSVSLWPFPEICLWFISLFNSLTPRVAIHLVTFLFMRYQCAVLAKGSCRISLILILMFVSLDACRIQCFHKLNLFRIITLQSKLREMNVHPTILLTPRDILVFWPNYCLNQVVHRELISSDYFQFHPTNTGELQMRSQ
jgi:hypothetical protein